MFKFHFFEVQTRVNFISKTIPIFENRSTLSTTYRVHIHKKKTHHCKINISIHRLESKMIHYGNTIYYLSINNFILLLDYYYMLQTFLSEIL